MSQHSCRAAWHTLPHARASRRYPLHSDPCPRSSWFPQTGRPRHTDRCARNEPNGRVGRYPHRRSPKPSVIGRHQALPKPAVSRNAEDGTSHQDRRRRLRLLWRQGFHPAVRTPRPGPQTSAPRSRLKLSIRHHDQGNTRLNHMNHAARRAQSCRYATRRRVCASS